MPSIRDSFFRKLPRVRQTRLQNAYRETTTGAAIVDIDPPRAFMRESPRVLISRALIKLPVLPEHSRDNLQKATADRRTLSSSSFGS